EREREPEKIKAGGFGIRKGELATAIDEVDERDGDGHHPSRQQQRSGGDAIDGSVDGGGEFLKFLFPEQTRKKRKRSLARSLSEYGDGDREKALGVVEAGDVADAAGGKVAEDPVVSRDQRNAQHERNREPHPLAECWVLQVERRAISRANFCRSDGVDQKWPGDAANERAEGQGGNSESMAADHSSGDDEDVVDERAKGRQQEQAMREQDR